MSARYLQDTALRYFLEVVRCGSINAASVKLNVVSSAISRQISALEAELDTVLFERRARGMVPSAAGEVLAAYAYKSTLDADRAVNEIRALNGLRSGRVRLCSTTGFATEFLPLAIAAFQVSYPDIQFDLAVGDSREVSRMLREGEADIGLSFSRAPERDIKVESRLKAPVMVVMRRGHPLERFDRIALAQLQAYPLALPDPSLTLRQLFDVACAEQNLAMKSVFTSNYAPAIYNFVAQSDAVSLSGEVSVRHRVADGILTAVPLRDRAMGRRDVEIQTFNGRMLPRAVQTFLAFIIERLKQHVA